MTQPLLLATDMRKSFGATRALDGARLDLRAGEIHALVGENGAGKSTLMNILGGVLSADAGTVLLDGRPYAPSSPSQAQGEGVGLVHQEIALCPDVSVAENLFMAQTSRSRRWRLDAGDLRERAREVLAPLHPVPPDALPRDLPIASQQVVEIAKTLTLHARVLILDEPTAALTEGEAAALHRILRDLRARGLGIVYISHRMGEIFALADRITVMRDGAWVTTTEAAATTPEEVASRMVGRTLGDLYPPKRQARGPVRLAARGLSDGGRLRDVSFEAHAGEVLGLGGLIGSGRTEAAEATCGLRPRTRGRIEVDGREVGQASCAASIRAGVAYLSEDRKGCGVFLDMSIAQNVSALDLGRVARGWRVDGRREAALAEDLRRRLDIRCASVHQPVGTLSGGNQQKVALARLLATEPRVLFVDEPTRGVDVGAKAQIYAILRGLAEAGAAIVVISSELPELIGLCDRVVVLHEGRVAGEVAGEDMTEEAIVRLASGLAPQAGSRPAPEHRRIA